MTVQWHYNRAGKQNGPVSEDQLKQLAASGKLQPSDMIWREGMDQWDQANTVPDLFPAESQAAPPPLPPAARSDGPGIGSAVIDSMKQVGQKAKDFAQSEQVQDGVAKVKAKWQSLSGRGKAITVGTAAFVILFAGWSMFGGTGQESRSRPTRTGSEPSSYSSSFQSSEDSEGFRWESLEDQDAAANSQRYQERGPMYSADGGRSRGHESPSGRITGSGDGFRSEATFNPDGSYSGSLQGEGFSGRSQMHADGSGHGEYEINGQKMDVDIDSHGNVRLKTDGRTYDFPRR